MKNNKSILTLMVVAVGIVALITIGGLSYAFFTTVVEEGDVYALKGKAMSNGYKITFTEEQDGIKLENTYPMPDEMGKKLSPYTFSVKSDETETTIDVKVILEVLSESTLEDNLVSVSIEDDVKILNGAISTNVSEQAYKAAYHVHTFSLAPGEIKTLDLRMWINSNGTLENAQNKTWSSRVLIVPEV